MVLRHEVYEIETKHLPPDTTYIIYLENIMSAKASGIRGKARVRVRRRCLLLTPASMRCLLSSLFLNTRVVRLGKERGERM